MSHRRLFLDLERRKPSSRIRGHFRLPVYRKVHDLVNRLLELPRPPPSPSPVSRNTWWTGPRGRECTVSSRCNRQKKKKKSRAVTKAGVYARCQPFVTTSNFLVIRTITPLSLHLILEWKIFEKSFHRLRTSEEESIITLHFEFPSKFMEILISFINSF